MRSLHSRRIGPEAIGSALLQSALADVQAFGRAPAYRRRRIEQLVDSLLVILDAMDGDADREPEEDNCEAEDWPLAGVVGFGPGDADDAELSGAMVHRLDRVRVLPSNLFARGLEVRHAAER